MHHRSLCLAKAACHALTRCTGTIGALGFVSLGWKVLETCIADFSSQKQKAACRATGQLELRPSLVLPCQCWVLLAFPSVQQLLLVRELRGCGHRLVQAMPSDTTLLVNSHGEQLVTGGSQGNLGLSVLCFPAFAPLSIKLAPPPPNLQLQPVV